MKPDGTLLLTRGEVAALLGIDECITAVESAFRLHAEGQTAPPGILSMHARTGAFHIKAALLDAAQSYFVAKTNANFPQNQRRFGLPLIQGVIVVCDATNGYPLALMDSIEITIIRTGAATGVAAKHLARTDARVATICGCGNQGRISLKAVARVRPIARAYAFDLDGAQSQRFASELAAELGIEVQATDDLAQAVGQSDICVTCTPARQAFLTRAHVAPGTFVAAVGADNEEKQELDPALMKASKVVVDLLAQCAVIGDLHHAIAAGLMTSADVHAELGQVIAGQRPGRTSDEEIIVFDSTGTALQDACAAATVYERAVREGYGTKLNFFA
jgi:alanine dehydrogenase